MKLSVAKVGPFLKGLSMKACGGKVFLLYGPDQGAVTEAGRAISQSFLGGEPDPLQRVDWSSQELTHDGQLSDEAAALPMFGGTKLIRIRGTGEAVKKNVTQYLNVGTQEECCVIIEAGSLTPADALRKLIEGNDGAMALPFFEADAREIAQLIQELIEQDKMRIEHAALASLASLLGTDRGIVRREIERLILFKGSEGLITLDDVEQAMLDQSHSGLDSLVDAVALGQTDEADRLWGRLSLTGTRPEAALAALRRHFHNLHQTLGLAQSGAPLEDALKTAFRPPLHFKRRPLVERQCRLWSSGKIETALEIVQATDLACRQTGARAETQFSYSLLRLSRGAQR